jgi:hypothetical protein
MKQKKFVGLDVHTETIAIVVIDEPGNILVQSIIATDAQVLCDFLSSLSGEIHLAFEVGTQSNWLNRPRSVIRATINSCNLGPRPIWLMPANWLNFCGSAR